MTSAKEIVDEIKRFLQRCEPSGQPDYETDEMKLLALCWEFLDTLTEEETAASFNCLSRAAEIVRSGQ